MDSEQTVRAFVHVRSLNNKYQELLQAILWTLDCFLSASRIDVFGIGRSWDDNSPYSFSEDVFCSVVCLTFLMKKGIWRGNLLWAIPWALGCFYQAFILAEEMLKLLFMLYHKHEATEWEILPVYFYGTAIVLRLKLTVGALKEALTRRHIRRLAIEARAKLNYT